MTAIAGRGERGRCPSPKNKGLTSVKSQLTGDFIVVMKVPDLKVSFTARGDIN
jgi:hypothetical protein